jgi:hypothetical protein
VGTKISLLSTARHQPSRVARNGRTIISRPPETAIIVAATRHVGEGKTGAMRLDSADAGEEVTTVAVELDEDVEKDQPFRVEGRVEGIIVQVSEHQCCANQRLHTDG